MKPYRDLTGQTFGSILVLSFAGQDKSGRSVWNVKCDCGKTYRVRGNSLTSGNSKSCGCKHSQYMVAAIGTGYGDMTGSLFSRVRCNAKSRGISFNVSKKQAWEQFQKQNGRCALSGVELSFVLPLTNCTASLDRIDSNKGYCPDNIQWVHKNVNLMKNSLTEKEFLDFVGLVAKHKKLN